MQDLGTRHRVSHELKDRHPYYPNKPENAESFAHSIRHDQVEIAFGDRCIPKLAALLELDNLPLTKIEKALDYMLESTKRQEMKCSAVTEGIINSCALLLSNEKEAEGVKSCTLRRKAARVIGSLSRFVEAREQIRSTGLVLPLTALIVDDDAETRFAASAAILSLASSKDGRDIFINSTNALADLVSSLPDTETDVNINTLSALALLTKEEIGVKICLESRCIDKLYESFQLGKVELYESIANTTWNVARLPEGKLAAIDGGLVPLLAKNMALCSDYHIRRCSSGALLAISVAKAGKATLGEEETIKYLCQALDDEEKTVALNSRNTIMTASELPDIKEKFIIAILGQLGYTKKLYWVYRLKSSDVLVQLLTNEEEEIRYKVIKTLETISEDSDEGLKAVYDCLYSVENLAQCLIDENYDTRKTAFKLLEKINHRYKNTTSRRIRKFSERNENKNTKYRDFLEASCEFSEISKVFEV